MIREITLAKKTVYFVADDQGMPVTFGYPSRREAESVEQLLEDSDGQATIPPGVDVEAAVLAGGVDD